MTQGFDAYAKYQTLDDASALAGAVGFGWIKATDGTGFVAVRLAEWVAAFNQAGLPIGPYCFAEPTDATPEAQADYFCDNAVEAFTWQLAPALDIETQGPDLPGFIGRWVARMRARGHQRLVVYSYTEMFASQLDVESWVDGDVLLWIADPNGPPGQPRWTHPQARVHQYGQGSLPGMSGTTDLDVAMGDVTDLYLGATPAPQPQEADMLLTDVVGQRPDGSTFTVGDVLANLYLGEYYGGADAGPKGLAQQVQDIHWKESTDLDLGGRPLDPATADDQFGHVLSTHALVAQLASDVAALKAAVAALAPVVVKGQ